MTYVDGYVLPVPKDKLEDYWKVASHAGDIWKEHGALSYVESVLEDPNAEHMRSFTELAAAEESDAVIFAYVTYRDRAHRDQVNAKVMADPRLKEQCEKLGMQFDMKRMAYGGFEVGVEK